MAQISVKNLKRVTTNGKALNEFNAGTNKPAFRSNGYALKFDENNADFLSVPITYSTFGAVDWAFDMEIDLDSWASGSRGLMFAGERTFNRDGLLFGITKSGGIECSLVLNSSVVFLTNTSSVPKNGSVIKGLFTLKNGVFAFDGVPFYDASVHNSTDVTDLNAFDTRAGSFVNGAGASIYSNLSLLNLAIDGDNFDLSDINSSGIVTSDSGIDATVTTSHASGVSYLLGEVWQKRPFAFEFEGTNTEYLETSNASISGVNNRSNLSFEWSGRIEDGESGTLFFAVCNNSVNNFLRVIINSNGSVNIRIDNEGVQYNATSTTTAGVITSIKLENLVLTVNGSTVLTLAESALSGWSTATNSNYRLGYSFFNTQPLSVLTDSIKWLGDSLEITEGLGNTADGATITTSHGSGVDRINYGMWLKSDGAGGWIPYT